MPLTFSLVTATDPDPAFASEELNSSKLDRRVQIGSLNREHHLLQPQKIWAQSQVTHISIGIFAKPTGNYTASSQTSYLWNYHLLTLALLMRHTRTSVIQSWQQQNCQFHVVAKTTVVGMWNANTSTKFLYRLPQDTATSSTAFALDCLAVPS